MDSLTLGAVEVSATDPAVAPLIARHLAFARASSPACSVHAMEAADLDEAGARFFAIFEAGEAVAMGAIKLLSAEHVELKSMHVRQDRRGRGFADAILERCLETARSAGATLVSLETGSKAPFAAARAFYTRHGFAECAPFGDYVLDPESTFMTRAL